MEYLEMIVDVIKSIFAQWDSIENVTIRLIDFVETIATSLIG